MNPPESNSQESNAARQPDVMQASPADRFFAAAIPRMLRILIVLSVVFAMFVCVRFGVIAGLGFAAGAIIAYLSLRSLNQAVHALAARIVTATQESNQPERGYSLVSRFFVRYLLAGIVAYVIFTSSSQAFRGFLFGLCTPAAALLTEAGFEAWAALRRGY